MKIRITMTVDVDAQAWADDYGIEVKDVRKDVQNHFAVSAQEQIDSLYQQPDQRSIINKAFNHDNK